MVWMNVLIFLWKNILRLVAWTTSHRSWVSILNTWSLSSAASSICCAWMGPFLCPTGTTLPSWYVPTGCVSSPATLTSVFKKGRKKEEFRKEKLGWYFDRGWIFVVDFYQNKACLAGKFSVRRENWQPSSFPVPHSDTPLTCPHHCAAVGWDAVDSSHKKFQVDTRKTVFPVRMLRHCSRNQERFCDLQGWRSCLDKAPHNKFQVGPVSGGFSSSDCFQPKLYFSIQSNQMYFYQRVLHTV